MKVRAGKLWLAAGITGAMAAGLWSGRAPSFAAAQDADAIRIIEKRMLSASTKKIVYCQGQIRSSYDSAWKGAASLSLSSAKLNIEKKGWYTFRIKKVTGKYKLVSAKLKKRQYVFSCNSVVKQEPGYYYLVPRSERDKILAPEQNAASEGTPVTSEDRSSFASEVWHLESAGQKNFRLKNVNSGLYLTWEGEPGSGIRQTAGKDRESTIFKAAGEGKKYLYIKNQKGPFFLHLADGKADCSRRDKGAAWKFALVKTEKPEPYAWVDDDATYPDNLLFGSAFTLKGTLHSRYSMKSLVVEVADKDGEAVLQKSVKCAKCSYDISQVDADISFGKLPLGEYYYRIRVTDNQGEELTALNRKFTVYLPEEGGARMLSYDPLLIAQTGHQSDGTNKEKKACASYALAYCNAIIQRKAQDPHSYWSSETDVTCVWSKGGYATASYNSEADLLQAAYAQIMAGKPCILYVKSDSSSQHWVTLIGYQNIEEGKALSAEHFLALDPWDGTLITVSDRYQIHAGLRLAYSNS